MTSLSRVIILETKQLHTHLTTLLSTLETQSGYLSPQEVSGLQSQLLMLHMIVHITVERCCFIITLGWIFSLRIFHGIPTPTHSITKQTAFTNRTQPFGIRPPQTILRPNPPHKVRLPRLEPQSKVRRNRRTSVRRGPQRTTCNGQSGERFGGCLVEPGQTAATRLGKGQTVTISREDVRG